MTGSTITTATAPKKSRGRLWLVVHGWVALPIWVLLFVVCVTGTLLTVAHELEWLATPTVRASNPDGLPRLPLNDVVAKVAEAYPQAIITRVEHLAPYMALDVGVALPDAPFARVHVNPYTGAVQGMTEGPGFHGFLFGLHSWLLFPWEGAMNYGWYIVTSLGFFMIGSIVTGLVVYKKFWKAFTQPRLRLDKGGRTFWGDLHRLVGVWSLWFSATIAITGAWFLVILVIYASGYEVFPHAPQLAREGVPPPRPGAERVMPDLDRAVEAAEAVLPGFRLHQISLPDSAYSHVTLWGSQGFSFFGDHGSQVFVDPYTGAVGSTRTPADMNALQVSARLLPSLHFGAFGGLVTKIIWFVFGLGLSAMVLSGIVIWTKRTAKATTETLRPAASPAPAAAE